MSDNHEDKSAPSTAGEAQQPQHSQPPHMYALQQPGPYVGAYPPYYPYPPPPTDANGQPDPNGVPSAYMMAFPPPPPGMIYAYPTAGGYPGMPFPPGMPIPAALVRPKRKQVKMACTNCASACKRCDEGRPCERCCKYGLQDSCQDGQRKERKKGIKRGPYKRKGKVNPEGGYEGFPADQIPPEGFYPFYYPSAGFLAVGPDGQPVHADPQAAQQGIPQPQYYSLHPASFPSYPFPHAAGGAYPMMPGHMLGQPGPSGTDSDGGAASAELVACTGSDAEEGPSEIEEQPNTRGKKRKGAASPATASGTGGPSERNEPSTSKRAGKKAATVNAEDPGGGGETNAAGGT